MAENKKHLLHVKSSALDADGISPKLPTAEQISHGELAINFLKDKETISLRNSENEIVTFGNEVLVGNTAPVDGSNVEIFIDESIDPITVNIYSKEEIDEQVKALGDADTAIKEDIADLETTVNQTISTEISSINTKIENIETQIGDVDTSIMDKVNANTTNITNLTDEVNTKIQVKDATVTKESDIIVDETVNPTVEIYDKSEIDTKVTALDAKDAELESAVNNKVLRGTDASTASQSTLLVDETDTVNVAVYTKAEVDSLFTKLKQLNPSLNWE